MPLNIRKQVESQLRSYLGSPIIPNLSQEDDAVAEAFNVGLTDYWTIVPLERTHTTSAGTGLMTVSLDTLYNQDIKSELMENAYVIGIVYLQFNTMPATFNDGSAAITGTSSIQRMVSGTYARNINTASAYKQNIIRGYGNTQRNPFWDVASGSISNNLSRKVMYDKLASFSGLTGTVEYEYNPMDDCFEFNIPQSSGGVLKYVVGYGFNPADLPSDATLAEKNAEIDKVMKMIPVDTLSLVQNTISQRFLEIVIAARGSVSFGGADYTVCGNINPIILISPFNLLTYLSL